MTTFPERLTIALVSLFAAACPSPRPQRSAAPASAALPASPAASAPSSAAPVPGAPPLASAPAFEPAKPGGSQRLAAGSAHSCFIDARHDLWCWGGNRYGEIGIGTYGLRGREENTDTENDRVERPTRVAPLAGKAKSVSAGAFVTCATTLDGEIFCWGNGESPKPGEAFSPVPVRRDIGGKPLSVSQKGGHACAVREDHTLWCWGSNHNGETGEGLPAGAAWKHRPPAQVKALGNGVASVATLLEATCALKSDQTVWCWGKNSRGELGDGSYERRLAPVRALGAEKATLLAAGDAHACALTPDGRALCWGLAVDGQLGNGQAPKTKPYDHATPQPVARRFEGVRALDLGQSASLLVAANGDLYAWGDLQAAMRGFPSDPRSTPHRIALPGPAVEIRAGGSHRCALLAGDEVWCWGVGESFQLGTGKDSNEPAPVRVVLPR